MFYYQSREVNQFLRSHDSKVSRAFYMRILALASIDILVTLPLGIVTMVLQVLKLRRNDTSVPFYSGWDEVHSNWQPTRFNYSAGVMSQVYFTYWTNPLLAFIVFGIFGITADTRRACRSALSVIWGKRTGQQQDIITDFEPLRFSSMIVTTA